LPMVYIHHLAKEDPRVLVSTGKGPLFSVVDHVVTSIPIKPAAGKTKA
jgi:hypothetical protein